MKSIWSVSAVWLRRVKQNRIASFVTEAGDFAVRRMPKGDLPTQTLTRVPGIAPQPTRSGLAPTGYDVIHSLWTSPDVRHSQAASFLIGFDEVTIRPGLSAAGQEVTSVDLSLVDRWPKRSSEEFVTDWPE